MEISAPVCGLRPVRAAVSLRSAASQPGMVTLPPLATISLMVLKNASTTLETVA